MTMQKKMGIAALALVLAAGAGLWLAGGSGPGTTVLAPLTAQAQTETATVNPAALTIKDFALGAEDAPVKMVEYASFTCPHCAAFHDTVFKPLKADYIDTGKVRFEFREVYFDRYGLWAAMVARCGGEMRYFGITDILFQTQQD